MASEPFTTYVAGAAVAGASSVVSDTFIVDLLVAIFGGFLAMTPREHGGSIQIWQGIAGVVMGIGVGLILRPSELSEVVIRLAIFIASILSTMIVYWLRNPAQGLEAVKAFAAMLQKLLSVFTGR